MKLKAIAGTVVMLILSASLIGVFNTVIAESIPTEGVFYGDGCWLFERGIYVIATETSPVEMDQSYKTREAYYRMLKKHVTTEACSEDFISILISRGLITTAGYTIEIKTIEKEDHRFVLGAEFTDPERGVFVAQVLTNPIALIPIGRLSVGKYSLTVNIDWYNVFLVPPWHGGWFHVTWTSMFNICAPATVDIDLDTLNLKSRGKWVTAYIELPEDYNVSDIDISTVKLNSDIEAELHQREIRDYDEDGIPDLIVKFSRQDLIATLSVGEPTLTITGEVNGIPFKGPDTIKAINE